MESIMNDYKFQITGTLAVFWAALIALVLLLPQSGTGIAASRYLSAEEFAEQVLKACGIEKTDGETALEAFRRMGLADRIPDGEKDIVRADAAILLAGAYQAMYGDFREEELLKAIREQNRLTALDGYEEEQEEAMILVYAAGLVPGYRTEEFAAGREFRGTARLTRNMADEYIRRLTDESRRHSLSPDGQLLRTQSLPVTADKFPYILESYPDSYYDWNLRFENSRQFQSGELEEGEFFYPADIGQMPWFQTRFAGEVSEYAKSWAEKAAAYAQLAFGVDYRTIEDHNAWKSAMYMLDADSSPAGSQEELNRRLERYIERMKENRTILEFDKAAADPSSLYYYNGQFYIRLYVRYRIISSRVINPGIEDILYKKSFNSVIYSDGVARLENVVLGEWRDGYYDIAFSSPNEQTDGSDIGISERMIQDEYYSGTVVSR